MLRDMSEVYSVDFIENENRLDMVFRGQLTINTISKITESVKAHLKTPSVVNILVKEAESIDLTFIQLLQAIKNSGKKMGFEVNVSFSVSDDISVLLKNAGFAACLKN